MIILLPSVFFGAIAYAVTDDLIWALIIGSGWAIILLVLVLIVGLIAEFAEDIKRKRRRKQRQADLQARKDRYERERSNR